MKKMLFIVAMMFTFSFASENVGDISRVEDFRQIDSDKFCAGVGFVKRVEDGSNEAGFIIYNADNNNIFSMALVDEANRYFSSYINSCMSNNESIILLQASETTPASNSELKLTLHKVSKDNGTVLMSKDLLNEYMRVYPCKANIEDEKVVLEVVIDERKTGSSEDVNATFVKKVLSFDDEFKYEEKSSEKVERDDMFECYKGKVLFYKNMFKSLSSF